MSGIQLNAYTLGYSSFRTRKENPYPPDSPEFLEWNEGCYDAQSHQYIDDDDPEIRLFEELIMKAKTSEC